MNEYLASAKGLLNWMVKQRRVAANPLALVQKTETRGKEVRARRAYRSRNPSLAECGGQKAHCL
jgi:hypothetical protein